MLSKANFLLLDGPPTIWTSAPVKRWRTPWQAMTAPCSWYPDRYLINKLADKVYVLEKMEPGSTPVITTIIWKDGKPNWRRRKRSFPPR